MPTTDETVRRLTAIPGLRVSTGALLSACTRFGIGGPSDILAQTASVDSFLQALRVTRESGLDYAVIAEGTNLIAADEGFRGVVLRFTANRIFAEGSLVAADAGAVLLDLVDFAIDRGLGGLETLAGIPGSVGAALYGNAGAYGHSISERVRKVRFLKDGAAATFDCEQCGFRYRESIFKRHKDWIIFSAELLLEPAGRDELRATADGIVKIRNEKFPSSMKCAGSIFKNLMLAELPPSAAERVPETVVREGKVPAAFFLERIGAKGMAKGDMHVADYHANLIYNGGAGTAHDLCELIGELKARVRNEFGLELEEEVQYVGIAVGG
jgi:UDP-N-acetylmuramate dehydrogenase